MTLSYFTMAASAVLLGASAIVALAWALRRGQMDDFQRGATSIFDADEPVGRRTEGHPGPDPQRRRDA